MADAEDVTQAVWLRAAGADLQDIGDLRAWLVTVAARRSYDILKSARLRREAYVGPWLPEPLLAEPDASQPVLVDESVSSAMLLIMEELSPAERVAFVLHDVFGLEFGRIAEVLDVSVPGARQLASRARRRVAKAKQATPQASKTEPERILAAFRAAYEAGHLAGLVRLLHPDAVYVTDGGGKVSAARKLDLRLHRRPPDPGRPRPFRRHLPRHHGDLHPVTAGNGPAHAVAQVDPTRPARPLLAASIRAVLSLSNESTSLSASDTGRSEEHSRGWRRAHETCPTGDDRNRLHSRAIA
ncbi:sigma factor-like helix-turn-helix DNA-binding protein [Streptomyces sp. CA-142005]|uniref:sigma factor-like helix-turn-helix DNA-binding protein n=1 Tax=Streptomyces sp. CA-142005 TaxID=3240052 RepID=UPI003D92B7CC